jgi:hypothetical protein
MSGQALDRKIRVTKNISIAYNNNVQEVYQQTKCNLKYLLISTYNVTTLHEEGRFAEICKMAENMILILLLYKNIDLLPHKK